MRVFLASIALVAAIALDAGAIGPLEIGPDGRHLVDAEGNPFLLTGDSAWSLFAQPTMAEVELYLQDRAARGFNFIACSLIEHKFCENPPYNADGVAPFTGAPFVTPNEPYFARCDSIIQMADDLGIVLLIAPAYQGWQCTDQGWCQEIKDASLADMRAWGRYVGSRYQTFPNIVWSIGGDWDPTEIQNEYREMVAGIRDYDVNHLMTAHSQRDTQAVTYWPGEAWLDVNNVFSPRMTLYQYTLAAYVDVPDKPFFMLESYYENEHGNTHQELRAQSYWSVLTGAFGVVFGNCPLWHFGSSITWCGLTDWMSELDEPGSVQMTHYRSLFESRRWHLLVPDVDNQSLVAGMGTDGTEEYAFAALASDGSSIIAYLPTPREVTFDTSGLGGSTVRAWSFDPTDATTTLLGDYPNGIVVLGAAPSGDRVLVLDDAGIGFGAPGTPIPVAAPAATPRDRVDQNVPNPFNPSTAIAFDLARTGRVRVTIHDASGRQVRELFQGSMQAGERRLRWDGADDAGKRLASGVYYFRLETRSGRSTLKMVLLK